MSLNKYRNIYCIGLKGSGMCALAILLKNRGCNVSGSDISQTFYTDELLAQAHITCAQEFDVQNIPSNTDVVIYSAAYTSENNEELKYALQHFECMVYPQALGAISNELSACAVIGTHGKTTTTAIIGCLAKALALPVMVLTGARVNDWNGNIWVGGNDMLVAEVCEYRNHLQYFCPNFVVYTSAELDHPDYFSHEHEVIATFKQFLQNIDTPKTIIACMDNEGVKNTLETDFSNAYVGYGAVQNGNKSMQVRYTLHTNSGTGGKQHFSVTGLSDYADTLDWSISMPGEALVANSVAALIFIREYMNTNNIQNIHWDCMKDALAAFHGISRRCEIVYQHNDITILDDYAHHPTAIKMTLEGIKSLYNPKRLIVDFMPHTYTRTGALLDDFSAAFSSADILILNDIYASAREKELYVQSVAQGSMVEIDGYSFMQSVAQHHNNVQYMPDFDEVVSWAHEHLESGDVFVTMGAGDNFRIAHMLIEKI